MPGDFKGTVFQKNRMGGCIVAFANSLIFIFFGKVRNCSLRIWVGLNKKIISRYCSFKGATDKGTLMSASTGSEMQWYFCTAGLGHFEVGWKFMHKCPPRQ